MADSMNPNIPLAPPAEWFTPPETMPKDAGCIVESSGRVFGYLCHWNSILMDGGSDRWKPPRSRAEYAFAHTGDTVCEDGSTIKTANLGGDAGHAPTGSGDLAGVQKFYENTQTQLARVRYGEDDNGVWFAGACWPTVTDLDIAKMRASARSGHWCAVGDWRDMQSGRSGYELVGACLVNVPGLKYARADRAASGVITLVTPLAKRDNREGFYIDTDGFVRFNSEETRMQATTMPVEHRIAAQGTIELQAEGEAPSTDPVAVGGVLVVEGAATEDGRLIEEGATTWRELPIPLYASLANLPGHDSASLVGRIDEVWRSEDDPKTLNWKGVIIPSMADGDGARTVEAIQNEALRGISIDGIVGPDDWYFNQEEQDVMTGIVIAGATLTPMPAIGEASVTLLATKTEELTVADTTEQLQEGDTPPETVPAVDDSAQADQWAAVEERLGAIADRIEYLVGVVESAQMAARYSAALQRAQA